MVYTDVAVFSPDETRNVTLRLLVDTGSTLTWLPADVLAQLGLRPREERTFRPIDARDPPLRRRVGDAVIECEGLRGAAGIVFGEPGDGRVLGVTALERLGLSVDPNTGELRKDDAYLALVTG